jgi:hypothetical protein
MAVDTTSKTFEETQTLALIFESFEKGFTLSIKDLDVFYFIEDIFSHSMNGVLRFRDMYGFSEFAPLTGDKEKIHIIYGVDNDVELSFNVYQISEIAGLNPSGDQQNIIELVLVDGMFEQFTQQKFSRSWQQESVSDIVKHILKYSLDITTFDLFEDSNEKIDFVMPYWNVKQAIDYLSRRGTGSTSGQPGYLFYNNSKGHNFVTLETLLKGGPRLEGETAPQYVMDRPDQPWFTNKILGWTMEGVDNFQMNKLRGGNRLGYDFSTKTFIKNRYTYSDALDHVTVLGRKTLYSDIGTSRADYVLEAEADEKILDAMFYGEFAKRYSLQQAVKLIVRGHEERFAGDMLEIKWPSSEKALLHNENLKGLYLVKSVTHQWSATRPAWIQKLVCIKNGYTASRNENLLNAPKRNLYGSTVAAILSKAGDISSIAGSLT